MLSFVLIALFVSVAIAAGVSLADSALKLRNAWNRARQELAGANSSSVSLSEGAVVMLRPHTPKTVPLPGVRPLAAAA
jgi:Flp pilus assembly pilin Flp